MRVGCYQLVEDGHNVSVGVLDGIKAQRTIALDQAGEIRGDEFTEHGWTQEWPLVEAIVRAQGEAIQSAQAFLTCSFLQGLIDPFIRFGFQLFRLISQAERKFHHRIPIGNSEGNIAVFHQEVTVAGLFPDDLDQAGTLIEISRVGMDKDCTVLITLGSGNQYACHILAVKLTFLLLHLKPLAVLPV